MASVAAGTRNDILSSLEGSTRRRRKEKAIHGLLAGAAGVSILISIAIVLALLFRGVNFLSEAELGALWSGTWRPRQGQFDLPSLFLGSSVVTAIAMIVATPLGLGAAIYLSENARPRARRTLKPILETLAGIPTIVLGFFAVNFISPELLVPILGQGTIGGVSALAGGIVVGLLVTPLIASISEDAMRAVPRGMREGAYAMGATKFEVIRKVVFPAGISGIMASIILAMSRAIGETMAVLLAVGSKPQFTFDPTESVQTMTAFIVQISFGETAQGSIEFQSLFAVGATLFVITFGLNVFSAWVVRRFRTAY